MSTTYRVTHQTSEGERVESKFDADDQRIGEAGMEFLLDGQVVATFGQWYAIETVVAA